MKYDKNDCPILKYTLDTYLAIQESTPREKLLSISQEIEVLQDSLKYFLRKKKERKDRAHAVRIERKVKKQNLLFYRMHQRRKAILCNIS